MDFHKDVRKYDKIFLLMLLSYTVVIVLVLRSLGQQSKNELTI